MEYKLDSTLLPRCYIIPHKSFKEGIRDCAHLFMKKNAVVLIGIGEDAGLANFFGVKLRKEKIKTTTFNDPSFVTCLSNDFGFEELFAKAIQLGGDKNSLIIVLSKTGTSSTLVNAIIEAHKRNLPVITFSGINETNRISKIGDINFLVSFSNEFSVAIGFIAIMHAIVDEYLNLTEALQVRKMIEKVEEVKVNL